VLTEGGGELEFVGGTFDDLFAAVDSVGGPLFVAFGAVESAGS